MDERRIITNYILDNYDSIYPGYYAWKKDFFLEWCYSRWACKDILEELSDCNYESGCEILRRYRKKIEYCVKHAKTDRGKMMFGKALSIVEELEGLFYE